MTIPKKSRSSLEHTRPGLARKLGWRFSATLLLLAGSISASASAQRRSRDIGSFTFMSGAVQVALKADDEAAVTMIFTNRPGVRVVALRVDATDAEAFSVAVDSIAKLRPKVDPQETLSMEPYLMLDPIHAGSVMLHREVGKNNRWYVYASDSHDVLKIPAYLSGAEIAALGKAMHAAALMSVKMQQANP